MELIGTFEPQITNWELKPTEQFLGINSPSSRYTLGLTPPDPAQPDCIYFTVHPQYQIENSVHSVVFFLRIYFCYLIRNNGQNPTKEFLFEIIKDAAWKFNLILKDKAQNTNVMHHSFPQPLFPYLAADIQGTIDYWERNIKNQSLS